MYNKVAHPENVQRFFAGARTGACARGLFALFFVFAESAAHDFVGAGEDAV